MLNTEACDGGEQTCRAVIVSRFSKPLNPGTGARQHLRTIATQAVEVQHHAQRGRSGSPDRGGLVACKLAQAFQRFVGQLAPQ